MTYLLAGGDIHPNPGPSRDVDHTGKERPIDEEVHRTGPN